MAEPRLPVSVLAALGLLVTPGCTPCLSIRKDDTETTSSPCLSIVADDTSTYPCLSPVDSSDTGCDTADTGPCDTGETTTACLDVGPARAAVSLSVQQADRTARSAASGRATLEAVLRRNVLPADLAERLAGDQKPPSKRE